MMKEKDFTYLYFPPIFVVDYLYRILKPEYLSVG